MAKVRAGIDIDMLIKELDELCSQVAASDLILKIYEQEKEHSQYIIEKYQRFMHQFEAYFDLLVRAIHHINFVNKSDWPTYKLAQLLLIVHNLKPMFSSYDRLMKGYYEDCNILLRTPYEAFFRVLFISLNPDDLNYSFAPRKKDLKQFNLTSFVQHDLKLDWHHYSVMSWMVHANKWNALSELKRIEKEGQKEAITLAFKFDEDMFSMGINLMGFLLLVYLRAVVVLFLAYGRQDADVEMTEKCRRYISLYQKAFASHVNPHLQSLAKDIEDIFQMLEEVEAGHEWKDVWNRLRNT